MGLKVPKGGKTQKTDPPPKGKNQGGDDIFKNPPKNMNQADTQQWMAFQQEYVALQNKYADSQDKILSEQQRIAQEVENIRKSYADDTTASDIG